MSVSRVDLYKCDRCKGESAGSSGHGWDEDGPPANWGTLEIAGTKYDLCSTCMPEMRMTITKLMYPELYGRPEPTATPGVGVGMKK